MPGYVRTDVVRQFAMAGAVPARQSQLQSAAGFCTDHHRGESARPTRHAPVSCCKFLNQEMTRILKSTEIRVRFLTMGVEAVGSTPEEFGTDVRLETKVLGKLIADLGIRND